MQAEVKSLFRKMPSWKSNIIWQQKRESEQAAVISEKITLCIHKYIYAKCSTFSRDGEWTETAVCAWDSWTSIQALRKVGRMQRSRCVCLTLSACSVSVGKWAIPPPSKSCSNLCQPAAACRRAEQASSSHQTAGLCTLLQGDNGAATPQEHGGVPRLLASHQTNYGQLSAVGDRVTWWSRRAQCEPRNSSRDMSMSWRKVAHKEKKRMK